MASLMDTIMQQYYSRSSGGSGSSPSNPMMSTSIGQGLTPNPVQRPFTPSAFGPLVNPRMGSFIEPAPVSAFMGGPPSQYGSATPMAPPSMPMGEPGYSGAAGAMVPTAAEAARRNLPGRTPGFLDRMLSGPDYQSNNMPVNMQAAGPAMQGQQMPNTGINWGDAQSAADFFRADQMLRQNPGLLGGM